MTQVSTFFAGVVGGSRCHGDVMENTQFVVLASTLQFSLSLNSETPAIVIINALWLGSLVLGIGSAFNSLLAMTMRKVVSSVCSFVLLYI